MNLVSYIILGIIVIITLTIILNAILKRKKGNSGCNCGCTNCSMADICHK